MTWQDAYRRFRDGFAEAVDARFYTIDHLDWLVETGRAGFWFAHDAAIITMIEDFPSGARALHGLAATGDLDAIVELIAQAEAWGRAHGCNYAMIEIRPGWARLMKPRGYAAHTLTIVKEL